MKLHGAGFSKIFERLGGERQQCKIVWLNPTLNKVEMEKKPSEKKVRTGWGRKWACGRGRNAE